MNSKQAKANSEYLRKALKVKGNQTIAEAAKNVKTKREAREIFNTKTHKGVALNGLI